MNKKMSCDVTVVHTETVKMITERMPPASVLQGTAEFFKALSDETRIRIIWALDQKEMCVCDLSAALAMTKSAISHQLSTLRKARLVRYRRDGKEVYYSLDDDHVHKMLVSGIEHVTE